ncbi:16S rRNA (cytidine(1402)-2'-O)-methyltransferase [candidate division WOR-3 bacterium]|nr:16S rRNA (cytidine(1402)-2'-O)-methyltransferase [candidate division WOR-3 bacterium]
MIYFAATPIGNLEDITYRVIRVMKEVDCIICESVKKTKILMDHYGIDKPLKSYNDFNKKTMTDWILHKLKEGKNFVFVTSAGSPLISDPGFFLVKNLIKENLSFTSLPGPSAVINSLIISGLPPDKFIFYGYLPKKKGKRRKVLESIKSEERTCIIFESPKRVQRLLEELKEILPEREIVLTREMTKIYEEVIRGIPGEILDNMPNLKGEFVVLIRGAN